MTKYNIYAKDDKGNVGVFSVAYNITDAKAAVEKAETYWMYVDAWLKRVE